MELQKKDINKFVRNLYLSKKRLSLVADLFVKLGAVLLRDVNGETVTIESAGTSPAYPNGITVKIEMKVRKDGEHGKG